MDVTQCKNKILELFKSGDQTNIELGMVLAESQGIDLQELCKGYIKAHNIFGGGGGTLISIINDISNRKMVYKYYVFNFIIPKEIELFTSVKFIEIRNCCLIKLPKEIASLKKLEHLNLRGNNFKIIPDVIFDIPNLKLLDLRHNNFSVGDKLYIKREFDKKGVRCYI
tara:strand:+ start:2167 stop:2670 length:504 start_codon:yes stop_codon:yes gene_type:complete